MATLPTPEKLARDLISSLKCRPGEGMPLPAARHQFGIMRPAADFDAAVTYAADQGWIELKDSGFWITLTALGFAEVPDED
jgi:hypothetical protein